jgi:hypothetical protein
MLLLKYIFNLGLSYDEAKDLKSYIHLEDLRKDPDPFPYWNYNKTLDKDFPPGGYNNKFD